MSRITESWNEVIRHLKATIPDPEYTRWFSCVKLAYLDSNEAVIEVPSKFHAQWLQEKYLDHIRRCFKQHSLLCPNIRFSIERSAVQPSPNGSGAQAAPQHVGISRDLTFASLHTTPENRFALASALEVATPNDTDYNPLFLFSALSLGKSHILHAIGNRFIETKSGALVTYLTAKAFSSRCISMFRKGSQPDSRGWSMGVHLFLLDDVHLLSGQYKVQAELIYLIDIYKKMNKKMVFTSKRPPMQLEGFDGQLTSRLQSGLVVEIQVPDQDSRLQILKTRLGKDLSAVPDDVLFYLAATTEDTKTLIESSVRLISFSSLQDRPMDIATAKVLLKKRSSPQPKVEEIQKTVASYFNISLADLTSDKKKRAFVYPRQLAMYICRTLTGLSYKEIGKAFSNRDHSSVLYAVDRIRKQKTENPNIQKDVNQLNDFLA